MKILMVADLHMDREASKAIEVASKKVPFTFVGGDIGLRRNEDWKVGDCDLYLFRKKLDRYDELCKQIEKDQETQK